MTILDEVIGASQLYYDEHCVLNLSAEGGQCEAAAQGVRFTDRLCLSKLHNVRFIDCEFKGVDFTKVCWSDVVFDSCRFESCNFSEASLEEVHFIDSHVEARFDTRAIKSVTFTNTLVRCPSSIQLNLANVGLLTMLRGDNMPLDYICLCLPAKCVSAHREKFLDRLFMELPHWADRDVIKSVAGDTGMLTAFLWPQAGK